MQTITLLDGNELEVNIPEGTQNGQVLRAKNKGMTNPRNAEQRGNLMMHLRVCVPKTLSKEQQRIAEELEKSFNEKPSEHMPGKTTWTEKAKAWLG